MVLPDRQHLHGLTLDTRRFWYLLVASVFALHNLEEAIAAPRMLELMQTSAPAFLRAFYAGIEVPQLRFSLLIVTALGVITAIIASRRPEAPGSSYTMLVFAALIGLNALAHMALTVVFRAYMPGLLTAILLTLPTSALVLIRGRRESWISSGAFLTVLPAALVVHGPLLAGFLRASIAVARAFPGGAA